METILFIDDENEMLESYKKLFVSKNDYNIKFVVDSVLGKSLIENNSYDLIITDLKMKIVDGMEILNTAIKKNPNSLVIMISGYGTIEASVEAMRNGAFDFLEKPFSSKKLFECIERALKQNSYNEITKESSTIKDNNFEGIYYKSNAIKDIVGLIKKIAPSNMNVLISGESGTGKELVARAIHRLSKYNENTFIPVNCGALPESLFESELFGHEKGAFTGAVKTKHGLLEFANNGTFFLDEVAELTPSLQVKLLRMMEDKKIRRVGGKKEIEIDVRIISATNKNLNKAVSENIFREDLFYRLSTIHIEVPPLRERKEDILLLANKIIGSHCKKDDVPLRKFSPEAEEVMKEYPWPGNVRELQNVLGRTYFLCAKEIIESKDLPLPISDNNLGVCDDYIDLSYKDAKNRLMEIFEEKYLTHNLKKNNGNISRTAELCGMDRRTIHRILKDFNIIYKNDK